MNKPVIFLLYFFLTNIITDDLLIGQETKKMLPGKPKLVIGIIINQMRYDYLFRFWDKYEKNGFKRLINEGSLCNNANYNYMLTQSSPGFATISTGANPSMHGIISEQWYVLLSEKIENCTRDNNVQCVGGNGNCEKHSPSKLLVSTLGDELKLSNYKMSKVITVSLVPSAAILLAGHVADAAYWFDETSGNFVSSSAYIDKLPKWVNEFNNNKFYDTYIVEQWNKLLPDSLYFECLPDNNKYEEGIKGNKIFPYDLNIISLRSDGKRDYGLLKFTPFGNNIIKDFAISAIVNENLGKGKYTDYICIDFSSTEHIGKAFGLTSIELEDTYLRLDKEIEHFLNFIDIYIGKGNALIYLTSDHGTAYSPKFVSDLGIPVDYFKQGQAIVLLKSYLNVRYGKGEWVKYYDNQQLYLNRLQIQNSKVSLTQLQDDIAQFLLQLSGVNYVVTSTMLQKTDYSSGLFQKMQNSFHQKRSGDIIICLEPGWIEYTDASTSYNSAYNYDTHVPLIFYGWNISHQVINDPVDITDIAPTISMILNISYPNACQGKPINKLFK